MAGRSLYVTETNSAVTHNIETVSTSRPTHPCNEIYGTEASRIIQPPTVEKSNKKHQNGISRIVLLGDSHARGIAGELLYQSNHCFNITGYVKPNARLTELLHSAKDDLSRLTSKDSLIIIGGSNDIDKSDQGKNLTSIVNFLDEIQNTSVILVEVPVRYDTGARSHINEQIEIYNKQLDKVTKHFKHVKLIKLTTNREHFTKHGLHFNSKGKEILSKELLMNLQSRQESPKVPAIQLPWKNDSIKVGAQIINDVGLNEILNTVIDADICKETSKTSGKICIGFWRMN